MRRAALRIYRAATDRRIVHRALRSSAAACALVCIGLTPLTVDAVPLGKSVRASHSDAPRKPANAAISKIAAATSGKRRQPGTAGGTWPSGSVTAPPAGIGSGTGPADDPLAPDGARLQLIGEEDAASVGINAPDAAAPIAFLNNSAPTFASFGAAGAAITSAAAPATDGGPFASADGNAGNGGPGIGSNPANGDDGRQAGDSGIVSGGDDPGGAAQNAGLPNALVGDPAAAPLPGAAVPLVPSSVASDPASTVPEPDALTILLPALVAIGALRTRKLATAGPGKTGPGR
ncbi:MAG TPA: hypothetical protein VME41_03025 [Stellaceae bacterium]|nr:hypothetical protein [Stellaceae bacterium]